jgi:TonB family protein
VLRPYQHGTSRGRAASIDSMAGRLGLCGCALLVSVLHAQIQPRIAPAEIHRAQLIYQVGATYPAAAKAARLTGVVILDAMVGEDGAIDELKLVGGHPWLVNAAFDAVKQWRYQPATRNGTPEPAATSIWVAFPSGSIVAPSNRPQPQPSPDGAARTTQLRPIDVKLFEGVWDGEEVEIVGINRSYGWTPKAAWTIAGDGEHVTRTEGTGRWSRSVTYALDGSETRTDGSGFPMQFVDSPDRNKYKLRRRVKTLTADLVELEEQVAAPATNATGADAYEVIEESWELSPTGNRLKAVRSYRSFAGGFLSRYSITYQFERTSDGPKR